MSSHLTGAQGLKLFEQLRDQVSLVLADLAMPILGGLELAEQIRTIDPAARILLMSAYNERLVRDPSQLRFPFIRKPFLPQDLVRKVREAMPRPAAGRKPVMWTARASRGDGPALYQGTT